MICEPPGVYFIAGKQPEATIHSLCQYRKQRVVDSSKNLD